LPILAAAGHLGLEPNLGLVIAVGLIVAIPATLAGTLWSQLFRHVEPDLEPDEDLQELLDGDWEDLKSSYGQLPTAAQSFAPILVPSLLIAIGSLTELPGDLVGEGAVASVITFLGNPMTALTVGLLLAIPLLKSERKTQEFSDRVSEGITAAAPILLITGAGGAFGAVLSEAPVGDYLGDTLSGLGIGILVPFIVAAALKTAQGSSTVEMATG